MGGAAGLPQRSSSPLKRRASDLEAEVPLSQNEDVDMISIPPSDPSEPYDTPADTSRARRANSIDMLRDEVKEDVAAECATPMQSAETEIPPFDEQIKTITTLCEAELQKQTEEGDKMYLVSKRWMERVVSRGSEALKNSKSAPEGTVGPIDNSDIIQQIIKDADGQDFVQLKPGSGQGDFTLFPEDAWNLAVEWYGLMSGSIPIERFAHNTNTDKLGIPNFQFEFHPLVFKVHRLFGDNNPINISQKLKAENPSVPVFVFSRSTKYNDFLIKVKKKAGIELKNKVRVWRVPRLQPASNANGTAPGPSTPPSSRPGTPALIGPVGPPTREPQDSWATLFLDVVSFVNLDRDTQRELVNAPDTSANANYNGSSDLAMVGIGEDQTIVLEEQIEGSKEWVSTYTGKKNTSTAPPRAGGSSYIQSNSQANSGRNSPAPGGPMTRGRTQKAGRTMGTVGLSNLGNTCYMNSALQCIRNVEELTKYFLVGAAKEDLNYDNPLGNNGEVANAYYKLLDEIFPQDRASPASVAPRHFKSVIGRYGPQFSGYGQQDSQEFLGFLLDGLQEDLSRVKKKPYIEKPDSTDEMINDPAKLAEMAAFVWGITKKRDDSVIADLFTGMYKSTLVCPACAKVSITFDPFNNLTLQLPIATPWTHSVLYFPLNDRPVKISVDIDKNATIAAMRAFVSKRVGVPVERLFAAEEFKGKFFRLLPDSKVASEMLQNNDNTAIYELEAQPTNWPSPKQSKKSKAKSTFSSYGTYSNNNDSSEDDDVPSWETPLAERMLVPVFHRRPSVFRNRNKRNELGGWPFYIILTPDQARNEDVIKRKILEKVATLTTSREFSEDDSDPDTVITTGSDADSAGDSKVVATSIDGDDEIVDVKMKDSSAETSSKPIASPFNTRRPNWVKPGSYLNPALQNMFNISYLSSTKEMVPTGWNTLDDDKVCTPISTRIPQVQQSPEASPLDDDASNGLGGSESGDELSQNDAYTRMNEESSDEDEATPPPIHKALPVRSKSGGRVNFKAGRRRKLKTYSKKGNKHTRQQQQEIDTIGRDDAPDDGPLVRPGEALVCDWPEDAWDAVFGASSADDTMRGWAAWHSVSQFHDPELEALRKAREERRKNGITLDDCLNEFGKEEVLSKDDMWFCPRCKEHRQATKKFEIWRAPDILVMHLKRFSSTANRRDKIDVVVDFPLEGLDIGNRIIEHAEGKQDVYDLFAVDNHWGGLGGGHYTAFAKNFVDHEWYDFNDSSVNKVSGDKSRIVSSGAYLLFYRRRSDVPLGGPRYQQIFQEYEHGADPDEETSESGEDRGLVGNSSHLGSSSALTGAGAARRQQNGSAVGVAMMTTNQSTRDVLPSYSENEDDGMPALLDGDGDVNLKQGFIIRSSIEQEDEAVDMSMGYNDVDIPNVNANSNAISGSWDWKGLDGLAALGGNSRGSHMVSGTGSDMDDAASDKVENNSTASADSLKNRHREFEIAEPDDFVEESFVPDMDDDAQASAIALQQDLMESMVQNNSRTLQRGGDMFQTTPEPHDKLDVEEPVTEIHIGDSDEVKMD